MVNVMTEPVARVTANVIRNARQSLSSYIRHVASGTRRKTASMMRSNPMMRSSTGILIMGKWLRNILSMVCGVDILDYRRGSCEQFFHFVEHAVEGEYYHAVAGIDDGVAAYEVAFAVAY